MEKENLLNFNSLLFMEVYGNGKFLNEINYEEFCIQATRSQIANFIHEKIKASRKPIDTLKPNNQYSSEDFPYFYFFPPSFVKNKKFLKDFLDILELQCNYFVYKLFGNVYSVIVLYKKNIYWNMKFEQDDIVEELNTIFDYLILHNGNADRIRIEQQNLIRNNLELYNAEAASSAINHAAKAEAGNKGFIKEVKNDYPDQLIADGPSINLNIPVDNNIKMINQNMEVDDVIISSKWNSEPVEQINNKTINSAIDTNQSLFNTNKEFGSINNIHRNDNELKTNISEFDVNINNNYYKNNINNQANFGNISNIINNPADTSKSNIGNSSYNNDNDKNFITIKQEKIEAEEQKEKLYLPMIKKINILETDSNSVILELPLIKRISIKHKNEQFCAFDKNTKNFKLSYVVFILNSNINLFEYKQEFIINEALDENKKLKRSAQTRSPNPRDIEDNEEDEEKLNFKCADFYKLKISDLSPNRYFFIRIFIKFGTYISLPSNNFIIRTSYKPFSQFLGDELLQGSTCQQAYSSVLYTLYKNTTQSESIENEKAQQSQGNAIVDTNSANANSSIGFINQAKNFNFQNDVHQKNNSSKGVAEYKHYILGETSKDVVYFSISEKEKNLINVNSDIISNGLYYYYCDNDEPNICNNSSNPNDLKSCNIQNSLEIINNKNSNFQKKVEEFESRDIMNLDQVRQFMAKRAYFKFKNFICKNLQEKIQIIKICNGSNFALALDNAGRAYSWGENSYGQLGLNMHYNAFLASPRLISEFGSEKSQNIFIIDIAVNLFSCLVLVIKDSEQSLYTWGLGYGKEDQDINLNSGQANKQGFISNLLVLKYKKNNIPIKYNLLSFNNNIIKILGNFKVFYILLKTKKQTILYSLGDIEVSNHVKDTNVPNTIQGRDKVIIYRSTKAQFFESNNLSILDCSISQNYSLFLAENLTSKKKEVYIYGFSFDEDETANFISFINNPKRIDSPYFSYPCKLYASNSSFLVLNTPDNKVNTAKQLYEVVFNYNYSFTTTDEGDESDNHSNNDFFHVQEISALDLFDKEIIQLHCDNRDVNIIVKHN